MPSGEPTDSTINALLGVLQQGDVILTVNGKPADVEHADEVRRILLHEDHVVVSLLRDGRQLTLDIEFR